MRACRRASFICWMHLAALLVACEKFPDPAAIDHELSKLRAESNSSNREKLAVDLLARMSNPQSVIDDEQVHRVVKTIAIMYREHPDPWVFRTFNQLKMDAGFATAICGFYTAVRDVRELREQVREGSGGQIWLSKCVGLSLDQLEYAGLVRIQDAKSAAPSP